MSNKFGVSFNKHSVSLKPTFHQIFESHTNFGQSVPCRLFFFKKLYHKLSDAKPKITLKIARNFNLSASIPI